MQVTIERTTLVAMLRSRRNPTACRARLVGTDGTSSTTIAAAGGVASSGAGSGGSGQNAEQLLRRRWRRWRGGRDPREGRRTGRRFVLAAADGRPVAAHALATGGNSSKYIAASRSRSSGKRSASASTDPVSEPIHSAA